MIRRLPPALAVVLSQGVDVLAQFAAGVTVARGLGVAPLGELVHAMAVAALTSVLLLFGTGDVALTLYRRGQPPQAVLSGALIILGRGAAASVAVSVLYLLAMGHDALVMPVLLAQAVLVLNGAGSVLNQAVVAHEVARHDLPGLLLARGVLVGGVALAVAGPATLGAVFGAYLLSAAVGLAWRARVVHRHAFPLRWAPQIGLTRGLWRRGRRVGVGAVFGMLNARADAVLLRALAGAGPTGLYGAAARLLNGGQAAAGAVALALFPGALAGRTRRFLGAASALSAGFAGAALLLPRAVVWLHGAEFAAAVPVLRWLLFAGALGVWPVFLAKLAIAAGAERALPPSQAAAALTNIGLNLWLIPTHGALGAAVATLAAEAVQVAALLAHPALRQALRAAPTATAAQPVPNRDPMRDPLPATAHASA